MEINELNIDTMKGVIAILRSKKFPLNTEKELQSAVEIALREANEPFDRERYLDTRNNIDFLTHSGVGIEIKIGGNKKSIYKQCERYAAFESVKTIILLTNLSMGWPEEIKGKPTYKLNLGTAWL